MQLGILQSSTQLHSKCHRKCSIRQQRWWIHSTSSSSSSNRAGHSSTSGPFFGRELEQRKLYELCSGIPTSISLILGPRNSGKTRLLQHFVQHADQPHDTSAAATLPATLPGSSARHSSCCHINARVVCVSTPKDMARALQEHSIPAIVQQLEVLGPFMNEGAQLASAVASFVSSVRERLKADPDASLGNNALSAALETFLLDKAELELKEVLASYHKVLDEFHADRAKRQTGRQSDNLSAALLQQQQDQQQQQQQQQPYEQSAAGMMSRVMPVLVLDEANVLMQWSNDYPEDLAALLRFFISVTKECNRSHVLLATSDSSFHGWLSKEIGPAFFQSMVVGDFGAPEARQFLDLQLARQHRGSVTDADWELVYEVCGGNPGALCNVACAYRVVGEFIPALQHVTKDIAGSMWWGMFPPAEVLYSAADYAVAIKLLLASPYGAVDQAVLLSQLPGGVPALTAMMKANLLALRPYSDWTADIPAAAYGPGQHYMVVTAPSPMHHYLMKVKEQQLLQPLQTAQQGALMPHNATEPAGSRQSSQDKNMQERCEEDSTLSKAQHAGSDLAESVVVGGGTEPQCASARSGTSQLSITSELKGVRAAIARLDGELAELRDEMLAAVKGGGGGGGGGAAAAAAAEQSWPAEASGALMRCAEQLREEKLQLRQMELLLLRAQLKDQQDIALPQEAGLLPSGNSPGS